MKIHVIEQTYQIQTSTRQVKPIVSSSTDTTDLVVDSDRDQTGQEKDPDGRRYRERRQRQEKIAKERRSGFDRRSGRYYATFLIKV
ncbi:hypothetical protein LIN78_10110 [Leeia sp. TBRC 13508]|uniref:Uncharacterized protein n=1 Tax=Leeia speluncae TaxID=2884804 RepID=A0ABS8D6W9_9NEIS|nr:hypothetical protein [Leeia speluncae]MCB6183897.1 hypothetical protein [Leeia speluncae]